MQDVPLFGSDSSPLKLDASYFPCHFFQLAGHNSTCSVLPEVHGAKQCKNSERKALFRLLLRAFWILLRRQAPVLHFKSYLKCMLDFPGSVRIIKIGNELSFSYAICVPLSNDQFSLNLHVMSWHLFLVCLFLFVFSPIVSAFLFLQQYQTSFTLEFPDDNCWL